MKFNKLLLLPIIATLLVGCTKGGSTTPSDACVVRHGDEVNELVATPVTDGFDLPQKDQLASSRFAGNEGEQYQGLGYVTLRSCTDGDTANFVQDDYVDEFGSLISIKTRFLGVNTPESTAKVEPWGKKASLFTKKVLTEAQADADAHSTATNKVYNIVLINSFATFGERDSSGNRWLAFVWYRPTVEAQWRLLNLELVEQAYSRNQLFQGDPTGKCNYLDKFQEVEKTNVKCGYRVFGEEDPDYDYLEKSYEYSLWYIIHHFDEIGISDSGSSGVLLCISALVVGIQGDNMFLRDLMLDKEQVEKGDLTLAGLYAYAGYNSSICSILQSASENLEMDGTGVGVIVRFFCRATAYNGNIQLSDVRSTTTGKKGFKAITEANFSKYAEEFKWSDKYEQTGSIAYADLIKNPASVRVDPESLTDYDDPATQDIMYDDLEKYHYQFIDTEVVIRSVGSGDVDEEGHSISGSYWYKGNANDNSYTVYATIIGKDGARLLTNLRIDTSLVPFVEAATFGTKDPNDLTSENSPVGKTFHVTGYMAVYFNKYQILLPNNYSSYNYLYKVTA